MSTLTETEPRAERAARAEGEALVLFADHHGGDTAHQFTFWTTETGELRGLRPAAGGPSPAAPVPSVADTATLPLPFGDGHGDVAGREGV